MTAIALPYNPQAGDPEDISQIMADFQAILAVCNGNLDAVSNILTAAAVAQNGTANAAGVANTLARSDHTHVLRGVEALTADPGTGNFVGRLYYRTTDNKLRMDITGAGGFITIGNVAAAELVLHAAQHAAGGADQLAQTAIKSGPFAHANRTADQAGIATGTGTAIALTAETADTDTMHDNTTNNSRLTINTAGVYAIVGQIRWAGNATGTIRLAWLRLNGTTSLARQNAPVASTNVVDINVAVIAKLAATDYVELMVQQDSGGALNAVWVDANIPSLRAQWVGSGT